MIPSATLLTVRLRLLAASLLLVGGLTPPAWALQVLPVRDGETAFARIAADDLTRIALSEGRIQSWHALKGRLAIEKNARTGQIYVRPLDRGEPASLFLTADSGATYSLTLQPVDMPAESLILKDPARRAAKPSMAEQADSRQRLVKELALMMAADTLPGDMEVRELGETLRLWQALRAPTLLAGHGSGGRPVPAHQHRQCRTAGGRSGALPSRRARSGGGEPRPESR
jgi:conjugal transfer pilus assembly protein TraK